MPDPRVSVMRAALDEVKAFALEAEGWHDLRTRDGRLVKKVTTPIWRIAREALAACDALPDEDTERIALSTMERQRDDWQGHYARMKQRAEAAEARLARIEALLQWVVEMPDLSGDNVSAALSIARGREPSRG